MANDHDNKLQERAKAAFDDSVDRLDGARLSALNRARHRALAELDREQSRRRWFMTVPGGSAAVIAVVVVTVLLFRMEDGSVELPLEPAAAEADLEILFDHNSLEMLEELEFYSWLEFGQEIDAEQTG